jgi:hypothetical protein
MKVILFGSTGMVGQGVLCECLLDPQIEAILSIGRARTGEQHAKLREIVHADIGNLAPIEDQLHGIKSKSALYRLIYAVLGPQDINAAGKS